MLDELPLFLTVDQAAKILQLGRSKTYELTVEYERTGGRQGLPFVWLGRQKRIPRTAIGSLLSVAEHPPAA